jgi:hypothetical protein
MHCVISKLLTGTNSRCLRALKRLWDSVPSENHCQSLLDEERMRGQKWLSS